MAQQAVFQIAASVIGVDNFPVVIAGHRVDSQVATLKIVLQRDIRCGVAGEPGITRTRFTFGTRQRILFPGLRMEKHGKIAAYLLVARVKHLLRRGADNNPIFIFNR